jgi:hypothetical protein
MFASSHPRHKQAFLIAVICPAGHFKRTMVGSETAALPCAVREAQAMTHKSVDYAKRYRDRATEMRALSEIMTHHKIKAQMLRLAHDCDDMANRAALERAARDVTSGPSPIPKNS